MRSYALRKLFQVRLLEAFARIERLFLQLRKRQIATHLEREAYVYVRQSSMTQVRNRLECQVRQYGLADRARTLGFTSVQVIDDDLDHSGTGSAERPGFGKLLAAVYSGSVSAVLALDASRLARNNRDWHHLIDLCEMTQTLVIDLDHSENLPVPTYQRDSGNRTIVWRLPSTHGYTRS